MNREKKQMAALGALALMIVCVGAFQFMGGSPEPEAPKTEKKAEGEAKKETEAKKEAPKNPEFAHPLTKKDPFQIAPFAYQPPEEPKAPVVEHTPPLPPANTKPRFDIDRGPIVPFDPGGLPNVELPAKPKFSYTLVGIVEGNVPAAVFADANGNQRLVETGQSVGSSATVLSISRGKVRVKFNAEVLTLSVGGNSSAK